MISNLLTSTIAKAVAGAFVGAIFLTGVAGASAAMGGPNVPAQAVSALGLAGDHNTDADSATSTATSTATATTTATSHLDATATETESFFGLCNAWSHGSDKGQANKQQAQGFAGLITAAGGDEKVADFCKTVAKPTETVSPGATTASATATSTTTPGNDSHPGHGNANANANGHPGGRPDGTPTPPAQ